MLACQCAQPFQSHPRLAIEVVRAINIDLQHSGGDPAEASAVVLHPVARSEGWHVRDLAASSAALLAVSRRIPLDSLARRRCPRAVVGAPGAQHPDSGDAVEEPPAAVR